jgi:hypothetical protein
MKPADELVVVAIAAALGLAGCSSAVNPLPELHAGDSPERVRALLGNPAEKQEVPESAGHQLVWIYTNVPLELRQKTGWSEVLVPGVNDQHGQVVQPQVTHDIYREPATEDIRVTFADGIVSSIEHLRR